AINIISFAIDCFISLNAPSASRVHCHPHMLPGFGQSIFGKPCPLNADRGTPGSETIENSSGRIPLLCNVTIPPATLNFIINCSNLPYARPSYNPVVRSG
nr:hypothetical protein [Tanacetum cinerariifolium]